ncbi:hypothetical protein PFISCL1PPCAC_24603, partial [Pristionchus fissidentatus]
DPTDSFSALSMYDNVTPVRRKRHSYEEQETDPVIATDSEDESLDRKFRKFKQASTRIRKSGLEGYTVNTSTFYTTLSIEASRTALKIDKVCRYTFPGCFLLFNLIYWWYYLIFKNNSKEYNPD